MKSLFNFIYFFQAQTSMPKRAETFNGASSTSKEEMNISCAEMLKSRMMYMKTAVASNTTTTMTTATNSSCLNDLSSCNHDHDHHASSSSSSSTTGSNEDAKSVSNRLSLETTTNGGVDSAYQSRVGVDMNIMDGEECSCVFVSGDMSRKSTGCVSCSGGYKSVSRKSSGISRVATIDEGKSLNTGTASIPRAQFENMIKFLLNDYIRVKNDNEGLKRELQTKDNTIDVLRKAIDECRVIFFEIISTFITRKDLNFDFFFLKESIGYGETKAAKEILGK